MKPTKVTINTFAGQQLTNNVVGLTNSVRRGGLQMDIERVDVRVRVVQVMEVDASVNFVAKTSLHVCPTHRFLSFSGKMLILIMIAVYSFPNAWLRWSLNGWWLGGFVSWSLQLFLISIIHRLFYISPNFLNFHIFKIICNRLVTLVRKRLMIRGSSPLISFVDFIIRRIFIRPL